MRPTVLLAVLLAREATTASAASVDQAACVAHLDATKAPVDANGAIVLQAAGASFPDRLYQDLSFSYGFTANAATFTYTSTGSGKGKCRIKDYCQECDHPFFHDAADMGSDDIMPGNIDFAGSDSLLNDADYAAYPDLQMYPAVAGAVVPIFNLRHVGIDDLVMTPEVVSQIFRKCANETSGLCEAGSISRWDDARIVSLNPDLADALGQAGEITVVVRQDKSGTTEIFKKSLASFEAAFATQIGTSSAAVWSGADVLMVNSNTGLAAQVVSMPGTIGYSVLAEATVLQVSSVAIRRPDGSNAVRANAESVMLAVMEKGLDYGNNGDDPSRLTVDIHDAKGSLAWPICGFTYLVVRKDTTRYGADCASRKALLDFLEWFYENDVVRQLGNKRGFASLPTEMRRGILKHIRTNLRCDGVLVYRNTGTAQVHAKVNSAVVSLVDTTKTVYGLVDGKFELDIETSDDPMETSELQTESGTVSIKIGVLENAPPSVDGETRTVELIQVASAAVYSLCGTDTALCPFSGVAVSMGAETLAKVLAGTITSWSHADIHANDAGGDAVALPDMPIVIYRTTDPEEAKWYDILADMLRVYEPSFTLTPSALGQSTREQATSAVYATAWSLTVVPMVNRIHHLGSLVAIENASGQGVLPSTSSILDLSYPFVTTIALSYPLSFSGEACTATMGDQVPRGPALGKFIYWFLQPDNTREPIESNGMGFLPSISAESEQELRESSLAIMCDGVSVMSPEHDVNLVPSALKIVFFVIVAIAGVMTLGGSAWIWRHRDVKIIRASTHTFMIQILIGAQVAVLSVVFLAQDDAALLDAQAEPSEAEREAVQAWLNVSCRLQPVLFMLGYGLVFTPLLLKTWRLHKLFNTAKLRKLSIPTALLVRYEIMVLGSVSLVLACWMVFDPLVWEREVRAYDPVTGLPVDSIGRCVCQYPFMWLGPLLAFMLTTLAIGNYMSYKARNIPVAFSEGKWISVALVNYLECMLLCGPLLLVTSETPVMDIIIKCLFTLLVNLGTVIIIFGPKVQVWLHDPSMGSSESTKGRRNTRRAAGQRITEASSNGGVTTTTTSTTSSTVPDVGDAKV